LGGIDRFMRSILALVPTLLAAAALAGCGESRVAGSLLYMTPYKFEQFDCTELRKRADGATSRLREVEQLRNKAGTSAAGPVINSMVYGPDYSKARWEHDLYQEEIARKNCDAPPGN
jgi:hypothetical protein